MMFWASRFSLYCLNTTGKKHGAKRGLSRWGRPVMTALKDYLIQLSATWTGSPQQCPSCALQALFWRLDQIDR